MQQAPAKLNQVTAELDALKRPTDNAAARAALLPLSLRQLESRLYQTLDELQSAQESLSTYNSQLVSLQTQPERVQSTMYAASQRLQEIRSQLSGQTPGQDSLRNSQQVMLNTEQALLNAQLELQRKSRKPTPRYKICCKNSAITPRRISTRWIGRCSCCRSSSTASA